MSGRGRRPSGLSGSGRETLLDVQEWLGVSLGCPGGPLGCPGMFGRPSRMSGSLSRLFESGREALSAVWDGLLTTAGHPEGGPDPSWTSGKTPDHSRTTERSS